MNEKPKLPARRPEATTADLAEKKVLLAGKAQRFGQLALLLIAGGVIICLSITGYFYASYGYLVIWGLPAILISGAGGSALLKTKWAAEREIEGIDIAIRKNERANKP